MKGLAVILNLLLLLVSVAAAQAGGNAAEIRNLEVVRNGDQLQVEITLSSPVTPSVITATGPERLVLELPNTSSDSKQKRLPINRDGVKAIRFGLNTANPPLTHVVVDLDSARAYQLATEGNKVVLIVLPGVSSARSGHRDGAPPAAASSPLMNRLHRQPNETVPSVANATAPAAVTPPAALPPLQMPEPRAQSTAPVATVANSRPSAKHPNFGSLQQGTVFPGMGTPGEGSAPAAHDSAIQTTLPTTSTPSASTIVPVAVVASMGDAAKQSPSSKPTSPAPVAVVAATAPKPSQPAAVPSPLQISAQKAPQAVVAVTTQADTTATSANAGVPAATPVSAAGTQPSTSLSGTVQAAPIVAKAPAPAVTSVQPATVASVQAKPAGTVVVATPQKASQPQSPAAPDQLQTPPATTVASASSPAQAATSIAPTQRSLPNAQTAAQKPQPSMVVSAATIPLTQPAQTQTAVAPTAAVTQQITSGASLPAAQKPQSMTAASVMNPVPQPVQSASTEASAPQSTQPIAIAAANPTSAPPFSAPPSGSLTAASATGSAASVQPSVIASAVEPAPSPVPTAANPMAEGMGIVPIPTLATRQPNADIRMSFKVKYVTEGAAYLDGGRSAGIAEGMKLEVYETNPALARPGAAAMRGDQVVAELDVISVAETSAVTEIHEPKRDVKAGDLAYLTSEDTETMVAQRSLSPTRKYPTVISFTAGDPLDEEARAEVPHPPLPEINRARGRIGFDYSGVMTHGGVGSLSSSMGLSVRTDFTRIGGTYWNMSGYWRGRLTRQSAGPQTLQDVLNRTYHLGLTYDNPNSPWVAGIGRLYLPWATSLDTIDGGYFGRRLTKGSILGIFAGSTPDPTSYSYNPDRRIGGAFVNFEGGSFEAFRYTSTSGIGISTLKWKVDRPFVFFENGIYYKRFLSIYDSLQADSPAGNPAVAAPGPGISRSFLTFRIQPVSRLEFDVNHTYFRDVPTFDPTLVGTGLLDKYLFQGFSAGPRIEVLKEIWLYSTIGRSSRSGDKAASLNQLYGINFGHLPWTRIRADVHWSKFTSSFGAGKYSAVSISRSFHESYRWELLAGIQSFNSTLLTRNSTHFATANLEAPVGRHYFFQGGFTWNRGGAQNYDQVLFSFGYRFDSRNNRR